MAAVIQRVVSSPVVRTEYLVSSESEQQAWGEKRQAHIFKTHALADAIAAKLREEARLHNLATGRIDFAFVHAHTIENDEWNDFKPGQKPAPIVIEGAEVKVRMDPKRMAEVLRDPVESYG